MLILKHLKTPMPGDFINDCAQASSSSALGGAISNYSNSSIGSITGDFINNYAQASSSNALGGAIYNYYNSPLPENVGTMSVFCRRRDVPLMPFVRSGIEGGVQERLKVKGDSFCGTAARHKRIGYPDDIPTVAVLLRRRGLNTTPGMNSTT